METSKGHFDWDMRLYEQKTQCWEKLMHCNLLFRYLFCIWFHWHVLLCLWFSNWKAEPKSTLWASWQNGDGLRNQICFVLWSFMLVLNDLNKNVLVKAVKVASMPQCWLRNFSFLLVLETPIISLKIII